MRRDTAGSFRPVFPWLPARTRRIGAVLAGLGALLEYAVLARGFRPKALEVRMFAVHAQYFERKAFTVIEKNVTFELATLLLLSGLFALTFSRDVVETAASERSRVRAILWGVSIATAAMFVATLTLFGLSFAYALSCHAVLTLALATSLATLARARQSTAKAGKLAAGKTP